MSRFPRTTFGWKMRTYLGQLRLGGRGARISKTSSLVIIVLFSIGSTFFFRSVFSNLLELQGIGEPLMWRIVSITMITVFGLLIVSNLITGISTLYKSHEIGFLMSRPVPYARVFVGRFIDNLVFSSWSMAVLGFPIIIAIGWVFNFGFLVTTSLIIFGMLPLVVISAEVGSAALIALILLARKTSPAIASSLVVAICVAAIAFAVIQRNRDLVVEGATRMSTVERYLANLNRESGGNVTPAHWMTGALRSVRNRNFTKYLFLIGLLTLTSITWFRWCTNLASVSYYKSWLDFKEMLSRNKVVFNPKSAHKFTRSWLPNPFAAMVRKDVLQFIRNPNQWAQFMILLFFLLVYLLNLMYISSRFDFDNPFWKTLVLFLNFAFTGFILATLSVRFVYPLISLEGPGFWIVRAAPISIGRLFWEKFFLAFFVFMGLCEIIVYISNRVLDISGVMMILTTAGTFLMGATLTAISIGMGALMPDFTDESPMRIASTPGGVLTVVISLVYVTLMVSILAWPAYEYYLYLLNRAIFPRETALKALGLVVLLNVLALATPIILGRRAIEYRDV
ncbi:hypothetical protein ACFLQV_01525 [Calditrichota bacterium]